MTLSSPDTSPAAVADVVKRLRELSDSGFCGPIEACEKMEQAADVLDTLTAERDALKGENARLTELGNALWAAVREAGCEITVYPRPDDCRADEKSLYVTNTLKPASDELAKIKATLKEHGIHESNVGVTALACSCRIAEARIGKLQSRLAEAVALLRRVNAEVLREPREVLAFLVPQPLAGEVQQWLARHDGERKDATPAGADDGK